MLMAISRLSSVINDLDERPPFALDSCFPPILEIETGCHVVLPQ